MKKAFTAVTLAMIDEKMLLEGEKENEYLLMESSVGGLKSEEIHHFTFKVGYIQNRRFNMTGP